MIEQTPTFNTPQKPSFLKRLGAFHNFLIFIGVIATLFLLLNSFVFGNFVVSGQSMEDTLFDKERILANRLPNTWAQIQNVDYVPKRGEIIVFQNPRSNTNNARDKFIVKRVIAFSTERVVVKNGKITVYNDQYPDGFDPDVDWQDQIRTPSSGETDLIVPANTLFVAGDHRDGDNSFDSRNGLGVVPIYDVVGPVILRWWPLHRLRLF